MSYLWVALGSALGGLLRYAITRFGVTVGLMSPWSTVAINVLGSFFIGWFGTFTLQTGRYPLSDNARLFVMVGICGGFTTFSSFSLQSFDLWRDGHWWRAAINVVASVILCLAGVAAGHRVAQVAVPQVAIAETAEEEYTG
jgi:CrcB protein